MAILVTPDADKKVHRHEHQFPEEIKQEKVNRSKNSGYARKDKHQIKMEKSDTILNLIPRYRNRGNPEKERQQKQRQTQAIHRQMKTYAETLYPFPIHLCQPSQSAFGEKFAVIIHPENDKYYKIDYQGDNWNVTARIFAPPADKPRKQAACCSDDQYP